MALFKPAKSALKLSEDMANFGLLEKLADKILTWKGELSLVVSSFSAPGQLRSGVGNLS